MRGMAQDPMKARLAAGETLIGTFLTLGSPLAAESLGLAGFDWLLVDLEHGGGDESLLLGQLMGCSSAGVHALARVESDVRGRTARALDLGVEGVMCPQVNSLEAAEAWASALHYGPTGTRGIALFHRGARYRHRPGRDRARAGADARGGPDRVARGGRGRGGDRVGGRDRRAVRRPERPVVLDGALPRSSTTPSSARRSSAWWPPPATAGKVAGIFCASPDEVPAAVADGFTMIAIGSDGGYMMRAARQTLEAAREAIKLA